jgi:hypothetical protein
MLAVATSGGPLAIALCFGAYSSCWFAVVGFLPTLQIERLRFDASTVVTALVTFVNVSGNLVAGILLARRVPRVTLIAGAAVPMAFCAVGIFIDGVPDLVRLLRPLFCRDRPSSPARCSPPSRFMRPARNLSAPQRGSSCRARISGRYWARC